MANTDDPPVYWHYSTSPFRILGIADPNPTPSLVTKAYHSKIKLLHSDKVKGREKLATMVTTAYNFLKHKTTMELEQLLCQFPNSSSGQSWGEGDRKNLSTALVDKTKSERYRRIFDEELKFAEKVRFKGNFQSFYKTVFEQVSMPSPISCGYKCDLCNEQFIEQTHHDSLVFTPYQIFVLDKGETGFWEYLNSIFEAQLVYWQGPDNNTGDWNIENGQKHFQEWCEWLPKYEEQWKESRSIRKLTKSHKGKITLELTALFSATEKCPTKLCQDVGLLLNDEPVYKLRSADFLLPAFLKVIKGVHDVSSWHQLASKLASKSARLAVLLEFCGTITNPSKEDRFYELGITLAKFGNHIDYIHLCFLLGSCDLEFVGEKLASLPLSNTNVHSLAAHYLCKSKNSHKLETVAQKVLSDSKKITTTTVAYHLALFRHYLLDKDQVDKALHSLEPILKDKYWKFLRIFAHDLPHSVFTQKSVSVAEGAVTAILEEMGTCEESETEKQMNELLCSPKSSRKISRLTALSGALHILQNNKSYPAIMIKVKATIKQKLDSWLKKDLLTEILDLARIPEITCLLEEFLRGKQFLGKHAKERGTATYDNMLRALRGVYFYKIGNLELMLEDMLTSIMYSSTPHVPQLVADFLAQNPMLHEAVLRIGADQWNDMIAYLRTYTGDPPEYNKLKRVIHSTNWYKNPTLSTRFEDKTDDDELDKKALERDILRSYDEKAGKQQYLPEEEAEQFAETGYRYVDLEVICQDIQSTLCCLTSAAYHFLGAMKASPENNVPIRYAYRALVLECCKELKNYGANTGTMHEPDMWYALRCNLSFGFHVNYEFSKTIQFPQGSQDDLEDLDTFEFIDEDEEAEVVLWQKAQNVNTLCLLYAPQIYTIAEGMVASHFVNTFYCAWLQAKVKRAQYSENTPEHLFHHYYFKQVWNGSMAPEDTNFEPKVANIKFIRKLITAFQTSQTFTREQVITRMVKLEQLCRRHSEVQEQIQANNSISLEQRIGFQSCRQNAMITLASLYGYNLADLETIMGWPVLRRTTNGFLDVKNRELNFSDALSFTRFCGMKIDKKRRALQFLVEPAIPGNPDKPPLFTLADLYEIFGGKIISAFLSFDGQIYPPNVTANLNLALPFHPFFKVEYAGGTPAGNSRESICGTNFHMTLLHLDLLLKTLTVGQEVGAKFPFPFRNTENHLLAGMTKELQRVLKPIGVQNTVDQLKPLEMPPRFWFSVDEVEQYTENEAQTFAVYFGKGSLEVKLGVPDEEYCDLSRTLRNRAELEFVMNFNANIRVIERLFPIIQRTKELAKISECFWLLHANQQYFEQICLDAKIILNSSPPLHRPFSQCQDNKTCKCCDWVPAIYAQVKVTDEQKTKYLFQKYGQRQTPNRTLTMADLLSILQENLSEPLPSTSAIARKRASRKGSTQSPKVDTRKYNQLENYRCYGGVQFNPVSVSVRKIILPMSGLHKVSWSNVYCSGTKSKARNPDITTRNSNLVTMLRMFAYEDKCDSDTSDQRNPSTETELSRVQLPTNIGQLAYIFQASSRQFRNTKENRQLLVDLANDKTLFLGTDVFGIKWNSKTLPDGKQIWVSYRNGIILRAGTNITPEKFNSQCGMLQPIK